MSSIGQETEKKTCKDVSKEWIVSSGLTQMQTIIQRVYEQGPTV